MRKLLLTLMVAACGRTGLIDPAPPADLAQLAPPWPMFQHDPRHSGRSPFAGPEQPRVQWSFDTGLETGGAVVGGLGDSPVISQDGIYFGTTETIGSGLLHALAADGKSRWSLATGRIFASPAVAADGTVYLSSLDRDTLVALDPGGASRWQFSVAGYSFGPLGLGDDGSLYAVGYGVPPALFAVNPDGSERWRFDFPQAPSTSGTEIAVDGAGTLYVGADDGNLYAIDGDGRQRWSFQTGDRVIAAPVIGGDGTIYVGSSDQSLYAVGAGGQEKWRFTTGHPLAAGPALATDGTLYLASADGFLYAFDADGKQRWAFADPGLMVAGDLAESPVVDGTGTIYFGDDNGQLFAVHPDGSQAWSLRLGASSLVSAPVLGDGVIDVFVSPFGNLPGSIKVLQLE